MENFKQIAEDCLAGKLSGTFVLRNGKVFHSTTHLSTTMFIAKGYYSVVGNCYSGGVSVRDNDVIDFIPDNMQKHIKIDIPEGKVPVMAQTEKGVIITWKEKEVTYDDVCKELQKCNNIIGNFTDNVPSNAFHKKVNALRKLTNIRNYFGEDKPTNMWTLTRDSALRVFPMLCCYRETCHIYFDTREHAEQAIKMLGDEIKYLFEPW